MWLQVAQQEAQRAAFVVEKAKQERQQKIVQAEGESEAAKLISFTAVLHYLQSLRTTFFLISFTICPSSHKSNVVPTTDF